MPSPSVPASLPSSGRRSISPPVSSSTTSVPMSSTAACSSVTALMSSQ